MFISGLNPVIRYKAVLTLAAILAVVMLAACGDTAATPEPSPKPASESGPAITGTETPALSPTSTLAPAQEKREELDPDAIVAAQEQVMIRLYEDLLPSVVHIRISQRLDSAENPPSIPRIPGLPLPDLPNEFFQRGEGSGFVWDEEGRVVTNNHVIQGADRVTVIFADREEIEATVIGTDPDSDLAVLELERLKDGARPATLGDSDALKVGQTAIAIGNPFGQQFTMTSGIISALGRTISNSNSAFSIPEVIQTDAPINPGNSGGPLLDRLGRVIGVNTQIISRSGVNSGIGFSVPINIAKQVIPALIADGHYDYSWLGITGSTLRPEVADRMDLPRSTGGALIIQVSGDSPADRGGLQGSDSSFTLDGAEFPLGGDIIVAIDGTPIRDMDDLIAYLVGETRPEDEVTLEVIRNGEDRISLQVTLGRRPNTTP